MHVLLQSVPLVYQIEHSYLILPTYHVCCTCEAPAERMQMSERLYFNNDNTIIGLFEGISLEAIQRMIQMLHALLYKPTCPHASPTSLQSGIMVTEGEPTDLIKVLHLLVLSFSWGMQVWVSFIAGMTDTMEDVMADRYACLV